MTLPVCILSLPFFHVDTKLYLKPNSNHLTATPIAGVRDEGAVMAAALCRGREGGREGKIERGEKREEVGKGLRQCNGEGN